jgi:hypothetical protein
MNSQSHANVRNALPRRRRLLFGITLAVGFYVLSYIPLTYFGHYEVVGTGRLRFPWGFAAPDAIVWRPRLAWGVPHMDFEGKWSWVPRNALGILFWPLIELDQIYWHKTMPLE